MTSAPSSRTKARLPRGLQDRLAADLAVTRATTDKLRALYESYGFDALETPLLEYTDALGKFLPDQDRPNAGVFSLLDDDEQWLSMRYDLTAPLARFVAENYDVLPKPYRSYRTGYVFRNEKPGPGRFRQFLQFDADTVGAASVAADAEMCMMMADALETLGIERGQYRVNVNNRKILDGLMEAVGLAGEEQAGKRLTVLRAMDKFDRFGLEGVRLLLGTGRKDDSGDFTKGAGLLPHQIDLILTCFQGVESGTGFQPVFDQLDRLIVQSAHNPILVTGVEELKTMASLFAAAGYDDGRIILNPAVVRGLEYYTGPVFEAELTFETVNEKGEKARFGSVAGGGRYDGLIARFRSEPVPATGFSIGVSRLEAALKALGRLHVPAAIAPVIVLVMDKAEIARSQKFVATLRQAGVKAELYLGDSGLKAQVKYADKRGAACVVIQGSDERAAGVVQLKDLIEGARLAKNISDNATWREERPAQITIPENQLVDGVKNILARYGV